jgi:hypothetical protein
MEQGGLMFTFWIIVAALVMTGVIIFMGRAVKKL